MTSCIPKSSITSLLFVICLIALLSVGVSSATPLSQVFPLDLSAAAAAVPVSVLRRADPTFPDQPPSCPICEQSYGSISSCAQAAPVLANVSMVIFNPGAFVDVIKCACTDTFQSAYPQCVDCFQQTNQTQFLDAPGINASSILSGIQNICAIESVLLGGVATADGEVTPTTSGVLPSPTTSASAASALFADTAVFRVSVALVGILFIMALN